MVETSSAIFAAHTLHTGQLYKEAYDKLLGNTTQCSKVANLLSNVVLLAVFIIGCAGAAQVIPGSAMGWSVVGLGGGYMAVKILAGNIKSRAVDLISSSIVAVAIIVFGTLGCIGVLTNAQMGYALIGSVVLTVFISSYMMIFAKHKNIID